MSYLYLLITCLLYTCSLTHSALFLTGSLERDREKLTQEIEKQRNNYLSSEEEIKIRDVQIQEISLKVTDGESKLRHQLSLYETIRNDRNNLAKSLNETSDELNALKKD